MSTGLSVSNLMAGYGKRQVLTDITLPQLEKGSTTALIGPNAAGKTTLLRAIARLHEPTGGTIDFDGRSLLAMSAREHARLVSYMPQALPQRVALSVIESVMAALRATPVADNNMHLATTHADAAQVLDRLGLGPLAFRMLDELSGGQRQLVSLAQAIARSPSILLLDEPTSALDPRHQISVMSSVRDIVRERGLVAVIVMHDLNLALDWCDRMALLANGGILAAGSAEETLTPENLAEAYGINARLERCSKGLLHVFVDGAVAEAPVV